MIESTAITRDFRLSGPGAATLQRGLIALGLALLAISGISLLAPEGRPGFILAYLVAYMFYLTISLGALFFVMLHHLTGARWSVVLRRLCEGLMMNLPLLVVLFIPVCLWLPEIYAWADPHGEVSAVVKAKAAYLNPVFFMVRAGLYFAIWNGLAFALYRRSLRQDATGDPALNESMRRISAPGMLLFSITITFAAFDWIMSLDAAWYSTIFGVYLFAGAALAILATLILVAIAAGATRAMGPAITSEHFHDLGKLLFAFVVFWAYIAFSQFLLIWMANIPEETIWYAHRWQPPFWRGVSWFLVIGHFILPFLYLLPRGIKRVRFTLALAALWILFAHYVDLYWQIMPTLHHAVQGTAGARGAEALSPLRITDLLLWLGLGCVYFAFTLRRLQDQPLVPLRDPHLADSIAFENA